jgi:hypothetical protein
MLKLIGLSSLPACAGRQAGLHRDNFLAKVQVPCPMRRQATPTNFIAGPVRQHAEDTQIILKFL